MRKNGIQEQQELVGINISKLFINIEQQQKPGRVIIVTDDEMPVGIKYFLPDDEMPVSDKLLPLLPASAIHNSTILSHKDVIPFLAKNLTDVVVVPQSLEYKLVYKLHEDAKKIDPTISFLSYSTQRSTDVTTPQVGFDFIPHCAMGKDPILLIDAIVASKKRADQISPNCTNEWFKPNLQKFSHALKSNTVAIQQIIISQLPLNLDAIASELVALQYEKHPNIESALTFGSQDGIRRVRFRKSESIDERSGEKIRYGIKKISEKNYPVVIANQKNVCENHPDIATRHSVYLLHAFHNNAHYVVLPLFNPITLGDSIELLSNSKSARGQVAIDAILSENLSTVARLQRPLKQEHMTKTSTGTKKYLTQNTKDILRLLSTHHPHPINVKHQREVIDALGDYEFLTPLKLSEQTRSLYNILFSVLVDNSPNNTGLEFTKIPQTARQLLSYLSTNSSGTGTGRIISPKKISEAFRIFESATERSGSRLEDFIHSWGCKGVKRTEANYARHRNHFFGEVMEQQQIDSLSDESYAVILESGPGVGWYKCMQKQRKIATQYLEKARLRFVHGELTANEFRAKVDEYVVYRQNWCDGALFFAKYLRAMKNGTAKDLEQESAHSFTDTQNISKSRFSPPKNAYVLAAKMLKNVDVEKIVEFTQKYVATQPNFVPFPNLHR